MDSNNKHDWIELLLEGRSLDELREEQGDCLDPADASEVRAIERIVRLMRENESALEAANQRRAERLVGYAAQQIREQQSELEMERQRDTAPAETGATLGNAFWSLIGSFFPSRPDSSNAPGEERPRPARPFERLAMPVLLSALVIFGVYILLQKGPAPENRNQTFAPQTVFRNNDEIVSLPIAPHAQAALGVQTVLEKFSDSQFRLAQGKVWLDVQKGGEGLLVSSPYGMVCVTGTSFGVQLNEDGIVVDVARGSVEFSNGSRRHTLVQGECLRADNQGLIQIGQRALHEAKPYWVSNQERELWIEQNTRQVAHWPLDELPENIKEGVKDRGSFGMDGAVPPGEEPEFGAETQSEELFGTCVRFKIAMRKQAIVLEKNDGLVPLKDFTVAAWVKRESQVAYPRILSSASNGWRVGFHNDELLFSSAANYPQHYRGIHDYSVAASQVDAGKWRHVAYTYEADQRKVSFFIDGQLAGSQNLVEPIKEPMGEFYIGLGIYKGVPVSTTDGAHYYGMDAQGQSYPVRALNPKVGREAPQYDIPIMILMENGELTPTTQFDGCIDDLRVFGETLDSETIRKVAKFDLLP
ncbi:FecR domain-containing protein [Candidatus Sumerlaeota bacterium]|nr:FecR domain-containing protein [Candidatus Sumerlaeota bacterium]